MRRTKERARGIRVRAARWWVRLAMGSAFTLAAAAPAVALADMTTDTDAPPDSPGASECVTMCRQPDTTGTPQGDDRQTGEQDHGQASYQPGGRGMWVVTPEHPYSQSHYQLGSGHQD
jgi:hypothetical protein